MVVDAEKSILQAPVFCTAARYSVVCVKLLNDKEVVVFATVVQVLPPLIDCSHLKTDPNFPLRVMVPVLLPEQTVVGLTVAVVPPTLAAKSLIVTDADVGPHGAKPLMVQTKV
jgi:hypothetical protein